MTETPSTLSDCPLYESICAAVRLKASQYGMRNLRLYLGPKDWKWLFSEVPELIDVVVNDNRAVKMLNVEKAWIEINIDWTLMGGELWINEKGSEEDVARSGQMANPERVVGRERRVSIRY